MYPASSSTGREGRRPPPACRPLVVLLSRRPDCLRTEGDFAEDRRRRCTATGVSSPSSLSSLAARAATMSSGPEEARDSVTYWSDDVGRCGRDVGDDTTLPGDGGEE